MSHPPEDDREPNDCWGERAERVLFTPPQLAFYAAHGWPLFALELKASVAAALLRAFDDGADAARGLSPSEPPVLGPADEQARREGMAELGRALARGLGGVECDPAELATAWSRRRAVALVDLVQVGTIHLVAFAPVRADSVRLFRFDAYWPASLPLQVAVRGKPGAFVRVAGQVETRSRKSQPWERM